MKRIGCFSVGAAFVMAALFQVHGRTAAAQTNCGDEGQSACTRGNTDFYINNGDQDCQQDLTNRNGTCVNALRHTTVANSAWANWAIGQQRHIASHAQINWITTVGTHNSYSSLRQGYSQDFGTNQVLSITDQLEHGARILEIDPHPYMYDFDTGHLTVCHGETSAYYADVTACSFTSPGKARFLGTVFQEIRTWLNKNPGEVLTLFIDVGGPDKNYVTQGYDYGNSDGTKDYSGDFSNDVGNAFENLVWTTADTVIRNHGHMPSIQQILNAGKQVILISNGDLKTVYVHKLTYYSATDPLPQSDTPMWPANSDDTVYTNIQYNSISNFGNFCGFNNGTGNNPDSFNQLQRGRDAWFRIAEGRSGSDDYENGTRQKLIEEEQVQGAALCTASYIELDFLYELDRVPSSDYQRSKPDTRFDASIWSWQEGENGQGQSAVMSLSNGGRWISGFVSDSSGNVQRYPAICMADNGQGEPYWGLQSWQVTPNPVPLYDIKDSRGHVTEAGAASACKALHGLFVPPYNAHENAEAYTAARNSDGGDRYWIGYTNNPESPHFIVSPQVFRFTQGGQPASAQVTIVGIPNEVVDLKQLQPPSPDAMAILNLGQTSVTLDANGRGTFTLGLTALPGIPLGQLGVSSVVAHYHDQTSALEVLPVDTFVTNRPQIALNIQQPAGKSEMSAVKVEAQVTNLTPGSRYQGTLNLYDIQDGPLGTIQSRLASIKIDELDLPILLGTYHLPAGNHTLVAGYEPGGWTTMNLPVPVLGADLTPTLVELPMMEPPDAVHLPASSPTASLTTTPHIELTSYSQSFTMAFGGPLPQPVALQQIGGTNSARVSSNQNWLSAVWTRSQGRTPTYFVQLKVNNLSQQLAPGTYQAIVTIYDEQPATNPFGMNDYVTVTLHVTTTLSASPGAVTLTPASPQALVHLISAHGGSVPITVTSNAAWLKAEVYPMALRLAINTSVPLGARALETIVTIHSEDAPDLKIPVKIVP